MKGILGYCLIAIPFLAVFWICVKFAGWRGLLLVLAIVGLILACVLGGVHLIQGGL